MLRTEILEQLPGIALMEVRMKLQTPDLVYRTDVEHKLITLCWGCHQTVCNACCGSLCLKCPLFGGRQTLFLQRAWAVQLSVQPPKATKTRIDSAPKCPTCYRIMCVLCDLGLCPGCLKAPGEKKKEKKKMEIPETEPSEPPLDCNACSRRLCSGCGRCECRRCQTELCHMCMRVRPRPCPINCPGSQLSLRFKNLPELPDFKSLTNIQSEKAVKMLSNLKNPHLKSIRCPACDRRCNLDMVLRVFCCRGRWNPIPDCGHGAAVHPSKRVVGGQKTAVKGRPSSRISANRLEMASCATDDKYDDTTSESESSGFPSALVPPHCRIFTDQCLAKMGHDV